MASRADVKRNVLALVIFVSSAGAQQGQIDSNAVPVEKEPQHHLVFANDSVRRSSGMVRGHRIRLWRVSPS
jgi:hypothetical protein